MEAIEPVPDPKFNWMERAAFWVAMASCILLTGFTLAEIAARVVGVQFYIAGEFNGMLMAWLIFFALPVVTKARQHLVVDFFLGMMSPRVRQVIGWIGALLMVIYVAALLYFCTKLALASWKNNVRSIGMLRTLVVYPQAGMVLGLTLMWISSVIVLVKESCGLFRRGHKAGAAS